MADASTPAASHTEGVASDTSTKSAPASKSQGGKAPAEHPMQQPALRPIMPGMMLAPMPMPVRPSGGAAPSGMSMPMVPAPFPFPGTIMAMPGMGPSMAPFMPPWAYPPMFGAMPMPMIGPNGQTLMPAGAAAPQGMGLMPFSPGAPLPPGMMLGMPPYMAAAMQPLCSSAAAGMGSPIMGIGMPLTSMGPASMGPLCMPPAAGAIPAAGVVGPQAAPAPAGPAPAPAIPTAALANPAANAAPSTATAPAAASLGGLGSGASTAAVRILPTGSVAVAKVQPADGMVLPRTAVAGVSSMKGPVNATVAALGGTAAAEKVSPVPHVLPVSVESSRKGPAESFQSSQQQLCIESSSLQQGEATHPPWAGGVGGAAANAAAAPLANAKGPGALGGLAAPIAGVQVVGLDEEAVHAAIEQLNVAELKAWVLAHFGEDVYLMLLDVWRPDSPKVRDAIWAWRLHVQQPRPDGAQPDYRAFLVSLFGLEKLLQVSLAAQQKGRPCTCSCAAHEGAARLKLAAAAMASVAPLVPASQVAPVDG